MAIRNKSKSKKKPRSKKPRSKKPGVKKPPVKRPVPELPPGWIPPAPAGEYMERIPRAGIILAIDPAGLSGFAILACDGKSVPELHLSGSVEVFRSGRPDEIVVEAATLAKSLHIPLIVVSEHSKNAHGSGTFGVAGFIGMIRAQGAWIRAVKWGLRDFLVQHGNYRIRRRTGIKPDAILFIEANKWRADVFGTTRFRDVAGKSHALRRDAWKVMAVSGVSRLHPSDAVRDDNESEAVLIGHWAARQRA